MRMLAEPAKRLKVMEPHTKVNEIAACSELLVLRVWIGVCGKEFTVTLNEESAFLVGEDVVAIDPSRRFGTGLGIVGVRWTLERAYR
jgi:hypothetical protein